jgi:RNA polymerase sigma-70 factor (ECF subfamily)
MPDDVDGHVLDRFVQGDQEAFEALFRQFERDVHRWIVRIVRDHAMAEDVLVEAFWRVYRSRARFDTSRSFGAWMRRVATNAAVDQLNASRRRRWVAIDDSLPAPAVADQTIDQRIARAFHELPPMLLVVARLAIIEEQPYAEIADALGVPVGTIKSRVFRATRILRKELTRLGIEP